MAPCVTLLLVSLLGTATPVPNNPYGAHLLKGEFSPGARDQILWAKALVGERGYLKVLFGGIDSSVEGAQPEQVALINFIYEQNLIPIVRLAGHWDGERQQWHKPQADPDGHFESLAAAVGALVSGLPRRDGFPLYIEVWNEPNLVIEWSGMVDLAEYGRLLVDVAAALRALGDPRIRILNGAFGLSPEAARTLFEAVPASAHAFDVWASHPYPHNHPPEYNHHEGTAAEGDVHTIDAYLLELAVVEEYRGERVPVLLTETGYDLGNATCLEDGYPIIDEALRVDYITRAFRDYWSQWPEVLGVTPFVFAAPGWERFNWVDPASRTLEGGLPETRYAQYDAVRALAKPTDRWGAISGRVTDASSGLPVFEAHVQYDRRLVHTNERGLYFLPQIEAGQAVISVSAPFFFERRVTAGPVAAGRNTVCDVVLHAAANCLLEGQVQDGTTGLPVQQATVACEPLGGCATADAQGRFTLADLPPVPVTLRARRAGYTEHVLERVLAQPAKRADIVLRISPRAAPDQPNQLRNPSFERGLGEKTIHGIALSWETLGPPGQFDITDARARTGLASQRAIAAGRPVAIRQITHYGTARVGHQYLASVWARAEGLTDGKAFLRLCATDNAGAPVGCLDAEKVIRAACDWTQLEIRGACPPGAERISVELHLDAAGGAVFWDDAYLGDLSQ